MAEKFRRLRLAADGKLNGDDAIKIQKIILVAGADAAQLEVTEDADGSGTNVLHLKALANTSPVFDFEDVGGVQLSQGYGDLTGTGPVAYIWWE